MKYLLFLSLFLFAAIGNTSPLPDFPFVAVTGESSQQVKPDKATITFRIIIFSESSEDANSKMGEATKEAVDAILVLDVPKSAITSYEIDKRTKRRRDEDYNQLDILGYEFSRRIKVEITRLDLYSQMMEKLLNVEYIEGFSTEFDSSKREEISEILFASAASNAKNKAEFMAKGLGAKIESVFAFNDSGSFEDFFGTFGLTKSYGVEAFAMRSRQDSSDIFIPQFIEINKQINVIYKLK